MRIKDDFYLSEVGNCNIVVAIGEESNNLNAMITLNESATFLWKALENGSSKEELIEKLTNEYEVDLETAKRGVDNFIDKLESINCIEYI